MSTKRSHILKHKLKAAALFKYVWLFSGHQALKGYGEYSAVLEKKIQVKIIVFNKKDMKILRISNSKNPPWNLVKFCSQFFLVNISRILC